MLSVIKFMNRWFNNKTYAMSSIIKLTINTSNIKFMIDGAIIKLIIDSSIIKLIIFIVQQ